METEQLRHFLKVAELANFTRAAEAIGLSQPALSRSIARLEEELGQPMFERQTRRVVLTDAGQILLERARNILALIDDAKAEISDDGESGRIRLAAIPTIAPYFLPRLLKTFRQRYPRAQVVVREDTTDPLLNACSQGEIDLGLIALPISAKHLQTEALFDEELLLLLPAQHPLSKKQRIQLADVEQEPFVMLGEAHCLADNILSFCRRKAFDPVSVERTSQLATVQELVALEHGISMVPQMARELDHSRRRVYKSLAPPKPTRRVAMVWNPYRFQSQLVENFKAHLRDIAAADA
jgi:LysR family transcriptional regulator, hydrogen peroxide-inducible genes activator